MQRHSKDALIRLTFAPKNDEGSSIALSAPATATIYDGAGEEVETGEASVSDGKLSYIIDVGDLVHLDTYKVVWSAHLSDNEARQWTDEFELTGGHLFEIWQLREYNESYRDPAKHSSAVLRAARVAAEQRIEHPKAACVAFVPRGARERLEGDGTTTLALSWPALRKVVSVTIDGKPVDVSKLILRDRCVEYAQGWPRGSVVEIHYEHGYEGPSGPVRQAAMVLAVEYVKSGALSSRAVSEATDVGFFRLSIAAPGGRTGIPEVDAVVADESRRLPL